LSVGENEGVVYLLDLFKLEMLSISPKCDIDGHTIKEIFSPQ